MIRRLFGILALDSDNERRRKLLSLLISGMIICTILALISTLVTIDHPIAVDSHLQILISLNLIISILILIINRFGPPWISSSLFLLSFIIIIILGDSPREVVAGRSVIFFTVPIVMSSVLLPAATSFIVATFLNGIIVGIALYYKLDPNPLQMILFFILALVSWISAQSLEGAIKELRRMNQELDRRVEERTTELLKINQQLETEINERIKTESALQESETRFREMADLLPTCIYEFDLNLNLVYMNKIGHELLGLPPGVFDSEFDLMELFSPEDRQRAVKNIEQVRKGGKVGAQEYFMIIKSGRQIYILEESAPIIKEGRVTGIRSSVTDITEQKINQNRLKEFATQLENSNRELQQFTFIASHDLQEPLRKIMVFGDRLKNKYETELGEDGRDYLTRMQNAASRMQNLINDLLTYARITSHAKPFETVDLNHILNEVISDLEIRIEQTQGQVILRKLPVIEAEPIQIRQLFQNLITNGLKFHKPDKSPVIQVYATLKREYTQEICEITVEDNGIGIAETNYERIFGVFQKLHGRSEYEGTGVGLAVCKKIVELHCGKMWVTSIPGEGSKFIVQLPVTKQKPKKNRQPQEV